MSVIYGVEGLSPIRMGLMFISYVDPALSAFGLHAGLYSERPLARA